jgi:hypothetical protein
MKRTTGIAAIAMAISLTGCQQKPDEKLLNACWSAGAKETVKSLSTRAISRQIVDSLMASDHGKATRSDVEQFVKGRLTVSLSNFFLTAADPNTGSVTCGADAAMTFKRNDGKVVSGDGASFSFSSYPSEGGSSMYVIQSSLPLVQLVNQAAESVPDESQSAAPASEPTAKDDPAEVARNAAAAMEAASNAAASAASDSQ